MYVMYICMYVRVFNFSLNLSYDACMYKLMSSESSASMKNYFAPSLFT